MSRSSKVGAPGTAWGVFLPARVPWDSITLHVCTMARQVVQRIE
jgi:hypothetical protein